VTARDALHRAVRRLDAAKIPGAQLDAELMLAYILGRDRAWLLAHDDTDLDEPMLEQYNALVNRRFDREPLVHLTGTREFYGLDFEITPDVLTPRTETEQLVDWALKYAPQNSTLIDIGTGSGALAIAIKHVREDLIVTATDISASAIDVASRNATTHNTDIEFLTCDLWDSPALTGRQVLHCRHQPALFSR
jgi:release factor glutamine methyltransferase